MNLNKLFKNAPDVEIEQLSADSRLPMKNAIFFCLNGIKYDGHNYINEAINNGAKVIVYSKDLTNKNNAIYIKVKNVNETLYNVANIFYNCPNKDIDKYIVSGCYGRSTVSSIIKYYLDSVSSCGSVGVFGINYNDKHLDISFPALPPLDNLKLLDNLKKNNIKNCVFETSIISLSYKKLDVIKPEVFIYTNTSKYCSDFQICNNMYYSYLRKYLYTLEDNTNVVLNYDDESYNELKDSINNCVTYGQNDNCDYRICNVVLNNNGLSYKLIYDNKEIIVESKLLGLSNVYNITAAITSLNIMGYDVEDIINKIKNLNYIDGVMEVVDDKYNVIVDCANEYDSIFNLLDYAKRTCKGNLIGVLGINYSDNESRIEKISKLCDKYLDKIIFTEDESLDGEVMNILSRTNPYVDLRKTIHYSYRSDAIENAINIMNKNDTLLIIGKGNERFMNMGLGKERYSGDKKNAVKYLKKRKDEENEII